jgi:hypothetical protein
MVMERISLSIKLRLISSVEIKVVTKIKYLKIRHTIILKKT